MEFIVVFGGESWEHEISIVSAITLKKELKNIAHFVFIDSENDAYLIPREMMKSTHFSSLAYKKDAKLTFTKGGFLQSGFLKKNILRGIVINLIHGKSGEDGQIAGLLDFYQIDFVGPRIEACAVSFSKEMTKIYAEACGVRVLEYCIVDSRAGNSSLDLHSADFANLGRFADFSPVSHPKFAKNHESQTENPSVVDSAESQNLGENQSKITESIFHCHSERSEESQKNNIVILSEAKNLKNNQNRDSSVASLSQNDNFKDFAKSSADSAESQNLGGNLPIRCHSERSEESQKNNIVILSEAKNLKNNQNRDSSVASLFQNDNFKKIVESTLDSAISTQEANSAIADEFLGFCEASDKDKTKVYRGSEPKQSLKSRCESEFATFPCIVKPSHLGSSLGIAVAKNKDDLAYALDCAFEFDERAIIEPFIPHIREFNLAGCKINGEFVFSMIEEVKKDEFFAFEDKYLDFQGTQKKQAADLSQDLQEAIKANFIKIYDACFEGALIRCDFFLLDDEIYLNEINPIPGSLAHYLFDDFNGVLQNLAQNLPKKRKIPVKYQYISKIQAQKGK